jgi:putative acetyltransferase
LGILFLNQESNHPEESWIAFILIMHLFQMIKMKEDIHIREARKSDFDDVMRVEKEAFGYEKEAILVSELLEDKSAAPVLSLLAFKNNEAVGHILFTKATLDGRTAPLIYLLAPLAIKPQHQKQGIGGMLINEGVKKLKEIGAEMIFVLGHESYYPKYGFKQNAGSMGFAAPYPIPEEHAGAWMIYPLSSESVDGIKGRVVCADALNKPEHWRE